MATIFVVPQTLLYILYIVYWTTITKTNKINLTTKCCNLDNEKIPKKILLLFVANAKNFIIKYKTLYFVLKKCLNEIISMHFFKGSNGIIYIDFNYLISLVFICAILAFLLQILKN